MGVGHRSLWIVIPTEEESNHRKTSGETAASCTIRSYFDPSSVGMTTLSCLWSSQ